MGSGGQGISRADEIAALAWWVDAGVDLLVDEAPRDWLAAPAAAPPLEVSSAAIERTERRTTDNAPAPAAPAADFSAINSLDALRSYAETLRPKPIFADGNPAAGVMIIGQDAAADDLRTGRPFSGPSGALLDRMLRAIGRDRSSVYLTNLHLWRTTGRAANPADAETSAAILKHHIALVRPRALLVMGGQPASALLGEDVPITRLRGRWIELELAGQAIPALATFNPAYLLRVPAHKALAWADLLLFKARIDA